MRHTLTLAFVGMALWAAGGATPAAAAKDSLVMAIRLEPPTLDPTTQAAAAVSEVTWQTIFEGLTRVDEKGDVKPGLAQSWTSSDAKTFTFKLRPGVKFQDGTPFTSADVKFTFERDAAPASTNKRKPIFANIASIATPDPLTVTIVLKKPNGLLPYFLAEAPAAILSPKTAAGDALHPIGTGPYRLASWVRGDSITLAAWPGYRDAAKVAIKHATIRFIGDASAQVAAMLSGEVDYLAELGPLEDVGEFKNNPKFQVIVGSTGGETFVALNNKRAPFTDLKVRQAVNFAIDRPAIIEGAMDGYGHPIASHSTPADPDYVDLTGLYPHDPAKAKALLAAAGFPHGLDVTLTLPPQTYARRSGEIVAQELDAVGMHTKIVPIEWAQWLDTVFKQKNYQATVIMMPEPLSIFMYGDPNYFFQYDSTGFRAVLQKIEAAPDAASRKALFQEAQKMLARDAVNAWMFDFPHVGIAKAGLEGVWKNLPMPVYDIAQMHWQ
jgi:peptide/nickel transport system substrate-binding protein